MEITPNSIPINAQSLCRGRFIGPWPPLQTPFNSLNFIYIKGEASPGGNAGYGDTQRFGDASLKKTLCLAD
jgi:hypothetical protein